MTDRSVAARPAWLFGREGPMRRVFWAVLGLGVALRLYEFVLNRGLHGDEAMLAMNLRERGFLRLLEPLDWNQGAPIGFLWVEKASWLVFGDNEMALRLWPLLMGTAALALFAWWAWTRLDPLTATLAVAILAIGRYPIYYSVFAKQYTTDLLVTVALYLLIQRIAEVRARSLHYGAIVAAGLLVLWFSHPSVFVIAGVGGAHLLMALVARDRQTFLRVAGFCVLTATMFLIEYAALLRHLTGSQFLLDWWEYGFMPLPPTSLAELGWFPERIATNLRAYTTTVTLAVAPWIMLVGAAAAWRADRKLFWVLLLPVLVTLLASGLRLYPFAGRLVLFLYPVGAVLLAWGGTAIVQWGARQVTGRWGGGERPVRVLLALGVILILVPQGIEVAKALATTERPSDMPPLLAFIAERDRPGDCLLVEEHAWPSYLYYRDASGLEAEESCSLRFSHWASDGQAAYARAGQGNRLWLLFSHGKPAKWRREIDALGEAPQPLERIEREESAVFLYEMGER